MSDFIIAICDDLKSEQIALGRMVQSYARTHQRSIRLKYFSSGESLLNALQRAEPIHLLFLDIYMPGLSGVETARRIRSAGIDLSRTTGWTASRSALPITWSSLFRRRTWQPL